MLEAVERSKAFRTLLIEFELFHAGSGAANSSLQRLARRTDTDVPLAPADAWSGGVDLPLTQEFLAQMMGVRRTSVTEVAVEMQKAGMISYGRGRLHITDLRQVQMKACECHEDVQSHYAKIMGRTRSDSD